MENSNAKLQALLQVDPSMLVRARIRLPVLPFPCLYQIFLFRESRYSCTALLFFLMPRCIHPCAAFFHVSHSFMRCTYSCVTFVHALRCVSLFTYQPRSLQPPSSDHLADVACSGTLLACSRKNQPATFLPLTAPQSSRAHEFHLARGCRGKVCDNSQPL